MNTANGFEAIDLEDIARESERRAGHCSERATHTTERGRRDLEIEGGTWRKAANVLRRTRIVPAAVAPPGD
jgi:hypothetical protein